MVWRLVVTKLEMVETVEGVGLNMRAPYSPPDLDSKYTNNEADEVIR